jgi:hypothetical protein
MVVPSTAKASPPASTGTGHTPEPGAHPIRRPVTATSTTGFGAWLRTAREHRGWTRPQLAARLLDAAPRDSQRSAPGVDSMTHNLRRWERGDGQPSEHYRLLIRTVLGAPPQAGNGTAHADSAGPGPALTVTISIRLPPGATAEITTTQPPP